MDQQPKDNLPEYKLSHSDEGQLLAFGKEITKVGKTVRASMYFRITSKEKILTYLEHKSTSWQSFFRSLLSRKFAPVYTLIVLVAFIVSSIIPVGVLNEVQASQVGKVMTEYGVVRVVRGSQEIVVEKGERLFIGDEVMVEAGAQASLEFIDNTSGVLKENSSIAITEVLINPSDVENSQVNLALKEGNFHVETGKNKGKEGTTVRVDTPSGVVTASQGSFAVAVENTGATEVVAYSDSVTVVSKEDGEMNAKEEGGTIAMVEVIEPLHLEETGGVEEQTSGVGKEELSTTEHSDEEIETGLEQGSDDETVQKMLSISEVNDLRTKLYFAEIKLQQAQKFFEEKNMDQTFLALYDYHERLQEVEEGYLDSTNTLPARSSLTISDLTELRRSGTILVQVRSLAVDANALSVYRDALLYLRRMVTLESTLRQDIPLYLANPSGSAIAPNALVYRLSREVSPTVQSLLDLEKERSSASSADKHTYTPRIEEHIASLATYVMKQADSTTRVMLLESILAAIPNTAMYNYMVLRFKIHFPTEFHSIIDAKASLMK